MKRRCSLLVMLFIISSCSNKSEPRLNNDKNVSFDKINLRYAKGFTIEKKDNCKFVTIKNPWQGAENVEYKYALINKNEKNLKLPENYKIIRTPINKIICLSTTHIAFIDVLEETESIVAISGTDYVNNSKIRKKIDNNKVLDIGYDNNLNYELIISLEPDLVITYGVGGHVAGYNQKLNDLGIQTMIIAEYLEDDPLGKLEWIKLIGLFYDKEEQANKYFNRAMREYNKLLVLTEQIDNKPKVLFGLPWKDVWFVPGGKSFMAKMVKDAGGDYIWKTNESRESLPFGIESIFANASDAKVWINTGSVNEKSDILKVDERFKSFEPFKNGKIYNNNLRINQFGGNDYWETGLIEPHVLLKDMIKIFHPNILPNHQLVYYKVIE
ncbi:MAG: ABC transporter substrate-binding protein [Bacteroidales bacterium]|nr:ABC transporter substrate-binding protein [Bacteroidales bacterium]